MKKAISSLFIAIAICIPSVRAKEAPFESHVDSVVSTILQNVGKLKTVNPNAIPMAFWDFDGTILKGDVSEGFSSNGEIHYKGLVEETVSAGMSPIYRGKSAYRILAKDYKRMCEIGKWLGYPFVAQIFEGTEAAAIDSLASIKFKNVYQHWYFTASIEILKRLEDAGIANYIISASPEVFVRNAAETLNLPRDRFYGIRVEIRDGIMTPNLIMPIPYAEGKVAYLKQIVESQKNGFPVAAFGNSYSTDAAFLEYIVRQELPGGAHGYALMINGGTVPQKYANLFHCVKQDKH